MKRFLKWVAGVLAALVVLAVVGVMATSDAARYRHYDVPVAAFSAAGGDVSEGARLAKAFGCRDCHGAGGQGGVVIDDPALGRLVAPSLARATPPYSDAELARLIRRGVKRDGTGVLVMPSPAYANIADDDLRDIIAWMRTLKPAKDEVTATTLLGPLGRVGLAAGKLAPGVVMEAPRFAAHRPADVGDYYYRAICSDCHALHEARTTPDGSVAPPLAAMGASYGDAEFARMLRTGVGVSKPDLGLMSAVARRSFSAFRDDEIAAIHAYLKREADKPRAP